MSTSHYYSSNATSSTDGTFNYTEALSNLIDVTGCASWDGNGVSFNVNQRTKNLSPELYFKFIKSKFTTLQGMRLKNRLNRLEKAFYKAVENGQDALARKFLNQVAREARESAIYAKGIKYFIEREDLWRHKRNIKDGHISDTRLEDFTRIIPNDVTNKINKVKDVFDGFVIYHYYYEEIEKKLEKKQEMSAEEKSKMRDPVVFGYIKECDRLYFVAEWQDEYCDLSFEDIIDVMGKPEEELTLKRSPSLEV